MHQMHIRTVLQSSSLLLSSCQHRLIFHPLSDLGHDVQSLQRYRTFLRARQRWPQLGLLQRCTQSLTNTLRPLHSNERKDDVADSPALRVSIVTQTPRVLTPAATRQRVCSSRSEIRAPFPIRFLSPISSVGGARRKSVQGGLN